MVAGTLDDWRKAGRIAGMCLKKGRALISPDAKIIDVLDRIEEMILNEGGFPAFPAQASLDHVAAHDCADPDDERVFGKSLVSLDIGVHVNGCIGDTALTIDLSGQHSSLVEASQKALEAAISVAKAGVSLGEVGRAIHEVITSYGFAPVRNLSGHGLDQYVIHAPPSIPNFDNNDKRVLQEGMIVAVEPFATTGQGLIQESGRANIFSLAKKKPVRNPFTRQVLREIEGYKGLPFTTRWLTRKFSAMNVSFALREMMNAGMLASHPPLVEVRKGVVSQAEHTLLITNEGAEVLTGRGRTLVE